MNVRQRAYCLFRFEGMTEVSAYTRAGYKGKGNNASRLEAKGIIRDEMKRLGDRREEKTLDLARECQKLGPEAIKNLIKLLRYKKAPQVQIKAIKEIFDRGYGKPKEQIDTGVQIIWDIGIPKTAEKPQNDT